MSDPDRQEEQRRRRRKRLAGGLLFGAAAVGLPVLANYLIARRASRLPAFRWGRAARYAWRGAPGADVVFHRLGEGPPLVFLHSFGPGHDASQWHRAAELLADDYTVIVPDLLGWGESDRPAVHYDDELYLQLIEDFLIDVVRRRPVVVASGLAAAYAVQLVADAPDLVSALALVGPQGVDDHADEPDLKDALVHRFLRLPIFGTAAMNAATSRGAVENHLKSELYASSDRVDAALIERHYRSCHQSGARHALAAHLAGYLNHDVERELRRVEVPVWLAWGREARISPVELAERWQQGLPHSTLEVFDWCGSLPHAETPGLFARRLRAFLHSHVATGSPGSAGSTGSDTVEKSAPAATSPATLTKPRP